MEQQKLPNVTIVIASFHIRFFAACIGDYRESS